MEALLKPLVFVLAGLLALPFVLTQLLFCSVRWDNDRPRMRKTLLPAALLNLAGNLAVIYAASVLLFRTLSPWRNLLDILRLRCVWQDIAALAVIAAGCAAAGLLLGLVLRRLFLGKEASPVSGGRKILVLVLALLCTSVSLSGFAAAHGSLRQLYITEVCRKTADFCYVDVANPGPLACKADQLLLSETEDNDSALAFPASVVPAGGVLRLTMEYDHGLNLSARKDSVVYLSLFKDEVIDRVAVPALAEDAAYCFDPETGVWEVRHYRPAFSEEIRPPVFSAQSGFYDRDFDLDISSPDGLEIRYTLDGSDPGPDSLLWSGPLRIGDRSAEENVWSARTDVSASFLRSSSPARPPKNPVDKCTVLRAVCVRPDSSISRSSTACYFVGYGDREGYKGLYVISLVTDPDNLFSDDRGIYVLGRTFRQEYDPETANPNWWWWPANYHQKGRLWEREVSFQFFDPDRRLVLSGQAGVHVKGGASAGRLPRGLSLVARKSYDGRSRFGADLFGNGYQAKRIALFAGGNDEALKIKDWLTARLAGDLDLAMNRFIPCCLFLDGEYWGNYWLVEQFDDLYFSHAYGLDKDNIIVVKDHHLDTGNPRDEALFTKLRALVEQNDPADPEIYGRICEQIDPDAFAAYYALQAYISNHDRIQGSNTILWRTRDRENSAEGDARWRPVLYDVNHASCYKAADADSLAFMLENDRFFSSLMNSPDFSGRFYAALRQIAGELFTPDRAEEAFAAYTDLMKQPLKLENARFRRSTSLKERLEEFRTFIRDRQAWALDLCGRAESAAAETRKEE